MAGEDHAGPATIVFSHANGFPAGTYRVLFKTWLAAGHRVRAIEKFGHDPAYPVTNNWPHLRDQLIHFIEREAAGPAVLVGHSLGGFLSLLAAARRPDLARAVVLLDSPVPSGWKAGALRFMKATGLGKRFLPSRVSRRRRMQWPSAEAAFEHFAMKPVFARWHPEVLRDYIRSGLEPTPDGQALAFSREVESEIYDTLPHHIAGVAQRQPLVRPVAFIGGRQSAEAKRVGLGATRRITQGRISWIEGSHLFPFERPETTALEVMRWIERLSAPSPSA
jgi:pimeloyl-ACP methyl ester carboxylesterase